MSQPKQAWTFGLHAIKRLHERGVKVADILALINDPYARPYVARVTGRSSFFGKTTDGRDLEVVVNLAERFVVTVIAEEPL